MSDFAPPPGPPPPRVPDGWKAVYNKQYQEWFYVNLHTKESTWEKPTAPAPEADDAPPPGAPPPSYDAGSNAPVNAGNDRKSPLPPSDNNPYHQNTAESDAEMAKRLQAEEDAHVRSQRPSSTGGYNDSKDRGQSDDYYNQSSNYPSSSLDPSSAAAGQRPAEKARSGSFLDKIKDKMSSSSSSGNNPAMGRPMMGYGAGGYPPQQRASNAPFYGPPPPMQQGYGGGGYGQPMGGYGQPMGMGGGYGGYGGQQQYMQQPQKKSGFGGKGALLGVGGGLLGGALLMDGIDHMEDNAYDQGYDDGQDNDMGGGDFGGGDF